MLTRTRRALLTRRVLLLLAFTRTSGRVRVWIVTVARTFLQLAAAVRFAPGPRSPRAPPAVHCEQRSAPDKPYKLKLKSKIKIRGPPSERGACRMRDMAASSFVLHCFLFVKILTNENSKTGIGAIQLTTEAHCTKIKAKQMSLQYYAASTFSLLLHFFQQ